MNSHQKAQALRIVATALADLADVLEGTTDTATASADTTAESATLASLPLWAQKRAKYLQAYVDNGGELSLTQVTAAAKKAGYGNPGSATTQGYVAKTGGYSDPRRITAKGIAWLEKHSTKSA